MNPVCGQSSERQQESLIHEALLNPVLPEGKPGGRASRAPRPVVAVKPGVVVPVGRPYQQSCHEKTQKNSVLGFHQLFRHLRTAERDSVLQETLGHFVLCNYTWCRALLTCGEPPDSSRVTPKILS